MFLINPRNCLWFCLTWIALLAFGGSACSFEQKKLSTGSSAWVTSSLINTPNFYEPLCSSLRTLECFSRLGTGLHGNQPAGAHFGNMVCIPERGRCLMPLGHCTSCGTSWVNYCVVGLAFASWCDKEAVDQEFLVQILFLSWASTRWPLPQLR